MQNPITVGQLKKMTWANEMMRDLIFEMSSRGISNIVRYIVSRVSVFRHKFALYFHKIHYIYRWVTKELTDYGLRWFCVKLTMWVVSDFECFFIFVYWSMSLMYQCLANISNNVFRLSYEIYFFY